MNQVFRKEKKFLIPIEKKIKYEDFLSKLMMHDEHNKEDGYQIRSLYFDTLNDNDFEAKDLGIRLRRKIRLRIYGTDQDVAKLEIKQKDGENQLKRSLTISKKDCMQIIKGNYTVLLNYKEPFAAECYGIMNMQCYRPKSVVEYNRKAFMAKENEIRVTFDSNIKSSETNFDIFDEKLVLNESFIGSENTVLEVKYNGFLLSYIKDMLKDINQSEISVSKYCLGRQASKYYIYM